MLRSYKGRARTVPSTADVDESAQVIGAIASIRDYAERDVGYRLDCLGGADAASRR
jgi:hypothetical protein